MKPFNKNYLYSLILLCFVFIGLYLYKPFTIEEISTVEGFVKYIRSFGPVMVIASFVLTVIQAVVPVIPFIILCSANGILFGLTEGITITMLGTLLGASLTFFISRRLGYEWASKKYKNKGLKYIHRFEGPGGFLAVLSLRLLPYFPAPLINVTAGVSRINYLWFLLASAIGKLPFIIGYTVLGFSLLHSRNYTMGAAIMAGLIIIPYLFMRRFKGKVSFEGEK